MAHLGPEVARQAMRGPAAATGAVIGILAVLGIGLFVMAPAGCGPVNITLAGEGVQYACGNLASAIGIRELHSIPLISILGGGIGGGVIGAWLGNEKEG